MIRILTHSVFATLLLLICTACTLHRSLFSSVPAVPTQKALSDDSHGTPSLVLMLVVDQLRPNVFYRLADTYQGGLAYLDQRGLHFTNTHHQHADTSTCPGHATIITGQLPRTHGIVTNTWFDKKRKQWRYCVEDDRYDRSPLAMQSSTLGDWVKHSYPGAKVYAASGKDRAAVTLGGFNADGVFWFDRKDGKFTTSSFYPAQPAWVEDFHTGLPLSNWFGMAWEPLREEKFSTEVFVPDEGVYPQMFPHELGGLSPSPDKDFHGDFYASPFVDSYLATFAQRLLVEEQLGKDEVPDLLALSFSAVDTVGHSYGPDSLEIQDVLLRLDRSLGQLFATIDREVGLDNTLVIFTADHGVLPLPEKLQADNVMAKRLSPVDLACIQRAGKEVALESGEPELIFPDFSINRALALRTRLNADDVEQRLATLLEDCQPIEKMWHTSSLSPLSREPQGAEDFELLFYNSFFPGRSPSLSPQFTRNTLPYRMHRGTTHGSPYSYDTHVPLVVTQGDTPYQVREEQVWTVDIAPTAASILGLEFIEPIDGQPLEAVTQALPSQETSGEAPND